MTADTVAIFLRAAAFVATMQAAGAAMYLSLFGAMLAKSASAVRTIGAGSTLIAVIFTCAHHLIQPARMTGAFAGIFDGTLQAIYLTTDAATANAVRIFGLVTMALGLAMPGRPAAAFSLIGATLVVVSFGLMGHTAAHDQRWILLTLLIIHLLVVAFWFGALAPLYIASVRETLDTSASIIAEFSAIAVWLVPMILFAGVAMSALLLEEFSNLQTPYGRLLLVKIAGFVLLMGLATLNKWRLGPAISAGEVGALITLRRSVAAEWCLIAVVLAITAAMTSMFSPIDSSA